ncbi:TIGR02281 family clan AA aspartic protease [Hyphomonas sp.]|uniref:retropepsin-like aspartic protease family protein n=1 Tax=Hyphomonas sp. TaxID=87 RepID=UPI0032EEC5E8|tara:strand:+ start:28012 stop:28542 length:531 start_codon:yes stop_codon:yes gene_type:complete
MDGLAGKAVSMIVAASLIAATAVFFVVPKLNDRDVATVPGPASVEPDTKPQVTFANAAIIDREPDGHYWTRADVDGTAVKFMVDTGASTVAITYRDAQRIGLKPEELDFKWEIRTAGGIVYGAAVTLERIRIGQVEVENVEGMVLREGLEQSLLGMTFLGELYSYEFRKSQLLIRQ